MSPEFQKHSDINCTGNSHKTEKKHGAMMETRLTHVNKALYISCSYWIEWNVIVLTDHNVNNGSVVSHRWTHWTRHISCRIPHFQLACICSHQQQHTTLHSHWTHQLQHHTLPTSLHLQSPAATHHTSLSLDTSAAASHTSNFPASAVTSSNTPHFTLTVYTTLTQFTHW